MDSFDLMKYIDMAFRRKYWIIIPFLLSALAGLTYGLKAPKIYEAKTLIFVQPQKVPTDFVRSIVSTGIEERLKTLTQQVTSRTNLESIVKKYKLYNDRDSLIDQKVALLKARIKINVIRGGRGGGNAFEIGFKGEDPTKVMQVTNALASNFIGENLKIRESQALGTSVFLADELESIRKRLSKKEALVQKYRTKFMGALPDQLQSNLNVLGRLQMQMEQLSNSLRDAENRKLIIQSQMADSALMQKKMVEAAKEGDLAGLDEPPETSEEGDESQGLAELKRQRAFLEGKYTSKHPDIIRLEKMIASMEEAKLKSDAEIVQEEKPRAEQEPVEPALPGMADLLKPQLDQIDVEIKNTKAVIKKVESLIDGYQKRVEETPKREQELLSFTRDYDNLRELFNSMLNRKLEAEIAVSMEKKQKGEQFRVVDPAKTPSSPIEPDFKKIILIAIVLGLGLGGGLAYLVEFMDTSYKTPDEAETNLKIPVLVEIPIRLTDRELRKRRMRNGLVAISVALSFTLSAIAIVFVIKGLDNTLSFIKDILTKAGI